MLDGNGVPSLLSQSSEYSITTSNLAQGVAAHPLGIAAQGYAKKVTKLIQLMTDLRASGAQADIDLPRIVVIGNQSAGKSSLVEAISGITVPRAANTCTRCPMECRLQSSTDPWRCQVLLRIERDEHGKRLPVIREERFGPVLYDKSSLEDMLRRAQLAILNPSVQATRFVDYDLSDKSNPPLNSERQLQFSCNVVCMDIQGPEVTNLSFIDLPGIISNVEEDQDRNNIDLIKLLVREHIQGNALILLTITMKDDMENQSAAFLAKEADPQGTRTIGVCTKPDTLQEGEHEAWMDVLSGRRHPLTHGYYVTKQPAPKELEQKLDYASGREKEAIFFSTDTFWGQVDDNTRRRLGVPQLTTQLSKLLGHLIEETLPGLQKSAKSQLASTTTQLDALPPPPPQHPIAELLRLVSEFSQDVKSCVLGLEGYEELIKRCLPAYEQFKFDILSTRPQFSPLAKNPDEKSPAEDIILHVEGDPKVTPARGVMYVDDVSEFVKQFLTRQLPYNVPFPAKAALVRQCFVDWPKHGNTCFEHVRTTCVACMEELAKIRFGRYNNGGLYERIRLIIDKVFGNITVHMKDRIAWLILLEEQPFTQNHHYFSSCRDAYLTDFKQRRQSRISISMKEGSEEYITAALASLAQAGYTGLKPEDLPRLLEADQYEEELIVMAEVCAYFRVAYKRIIDTLPRIIDLDFLSEFSKQIHPALIEGLELGENHSALRAEAYLSEDPDTVTRRRELETTKARLEDILSKLFAFGTGSV